MKVLLSIKPEFADRIFSGTKGYEFRRSIFKNRSIRTVVVYATRPIGKIIGEFDICEILCDQPAHIWQKTCSKAGITKEFFDNYFKDRQQGFAIAIGEVRRYENPLDPKEIIENFSPPQSFMYLDDSLRRVPEPNETLSLF